MTKWPDSSGAMGTAMLFVALMFASCSDVPDGSPPEVRLRRVPMTREQAVIVLSRERLCLDGITPDGEEGLVRLRNLLPNDPDVPNNAYRVDKYHKEYGEGGLMTLHGTTEFYSDLSEAMDALTSAGIKVFYRCSFARID